jgi:hypothetical protein
MTDRKQIEAEMNAKIAEGESKLEKLKAKMAEVDDDAKQEMQEAIDKVEGVLDKGKAKAKQLADATDDQFDELWADTKEGWHDVKHGLEKGWDNLSDRVKAFFA